MGALCAEHHVRLQHAVGALDVPGPAVERVSERRHFQPPDGPWRQPQLPLLERLGARTVFSHFLGISLSKFPGEECFEGYLGTLDAFLRAGANLGVPNPVGTAGSSTKTAFGNLARRRPEESVLASFCTELKGLLARLAADPQRAMFVPSVVEKLILYCSGTEEDLRELGLAVSQGYPTHIVAPLSRLIAFKMGGRREQGAARKRL